MAKGFLSKDWEKAVVGMIAILLLGVWAGMIDVNLGGEEATVAPEPASTGQTADLTGICTIDDVYIDVLARDKYNPATELLNKAYAWIILDDGSRHSITATNSSGDDDFTFAPGQEVEFLLVEDNDGDLNTDQGGPDNYGELKTYTVPCIGQDHVVFDAAREGSSATLTVWNEDGTVNAYATRQAMGADTTYALDFKFKAEHEKCYGIEGEMNIACVEFDATYWKDVEITNMAVGSVDYGDAKAAAIPENQDTTANKTKCYYVPAVCNSQSLTGTFAIETDATQPAADDNVTGQFHDAAWYIDADSDLVEKGVEDEDGNNIGIEDGNHVNISIQAS
jgi:hypothetical protein